MSEHRKFSEEYEPSNFPKYTYTIVWNSEDQEYIATVKEYPCLSGIHIDPQRALRELIWALGLANQNIEIE